MKKSSILWITTGFILLTLGMALLLTLPLILLKIIDSKLILNPDNPSWPLWKDLPIPIVQKFYFYNVTNGPEVQSKGAVPQLQQIGPFVYRLDVKKHGVKLTDDDRSVAFTERMAYYFDREMSVDDLSLQITTLNAPLAIALALIDNLKSQIAKTAALGTVAFLDEDFFIKKSVRELLFDGYPDFLTKLAPILNPKIPFQPSFGWMYGKNETDDGLFVVNTGKADINRVNEIETLNGLPELQFWSGSRCNSLNGAKNGELFNPIPSIDRSLLLFRTNFCRVLSLVWNQTLQSKYGKLRVYRYFPADNSYANSTDYPPNSCYKPNQNVSFADIGDNDGDDVDIPTLLKRVKTLVNDTDVIEKLENLYMDFLANGSQAFDLNANISDHEWGKYRDYPSGVFDLSVCYFGAPVFISNPHFLKADPYFLTTVSGLTPDPTLHQSYLDIEPQTGTPIELELRVQINVHINQLASYFPKYWHMPRIHVPVLWQEFTIHATDDLAGDLHWKLTGPSIIATTISSVFVVIGVLTLLWVLSKPVMRRCKHNNGPVMVADDDNAVGTCDTSALITDNNDHKDSQPVIT